MSTAAPFAVLALAAVVVVVAATPAAARPLPALDRRVIDEATALDAAARAQLESKLAEYQQRSGHQFAVVILRALDGDVLEQLSMRAAEQWRLGDRRRDDGLLIVLAMEERAVRIEVGYGLEGVVTDALSSRVIRNVMAPRFAQGDIAGGLDAGLVVLMQAAAGESAGEGPSGVGSIVQQSPSWLQLALPIMLAVAFLLTGIARRRGGQGYAGRGRAGGGAGGGLWALWLLTSMLGGGRHGGGGGGFSGGGGGFGGGGASGRW